MPAYLELPAHLSVPELERRYRSARDPVARSHWQIIWLLSTGQRAPAVAQVTGYSVNWVRVIAGRYRDAGAKGVGDRRHANPGGRERTLLDAAGRAALRTALGGPAPDGSLWTSRQVASWMSSYLGRPVRPQRGWEYLRQAGFTPQQPRPTATQADPVAQAVAKKGGSKRRSTP